MPKDYGYSEAEVIELETRLASLAESFSALLVRLLKYCREKKIPLREEELPRRMLARIMTTLSEIKDIEQLSDIVPVFEQAKALADDKRPPDKLPVYL